MSKTKVALIGYGKMGKTINELAQNYSVEIVARIGKDEPFNLNGADVAIEFTTPAHAKQNIIKCFELGVPVVSGTTGWQEDLPKTIELCKSLNASFLWASNFSVGVHIFFAINKKLAAIMAHQTQYDTHLTEIHHTQKLDAPSGTAVTLAQGILENNSNWQKWHLKESLLTAEPIVASIPITAIREAEVPGTHIVTYASTVDSIEIKHEAHSRLGFATGALIAAKWLKDKKGFFSMEDVLNL
ncbi:MAG: 4-hydroxy-tetrahydrodipicolinate reductase [Luteibaculaceae bacterium]